MASSTHRPRPSTTATLTVCLLTVLAGCGGLGGTFGEDTPDRTPFSAPVQYPPGVSESGSVDAYDLLSSHADGLEGRSVTVRHRVVQRFVDGGSAGEVRYRSESVGRYGETPRHWYVVREVSGTNVPVFGGESGRVRLWSNRTVSVRSVTVNDTTSYEGRAPTRAVDRAGFDRLFTLISALDPEFVERQERNGTETFLLRAERTTLPGDGVLGGTVASSSLSDPRNASLSVRVTDDGVVRSYDLTYVATAGNRTVEVVESVQFEGVGSTTVPRPAWVDTAVLLVCADDARPDWCGRP